MPYVDDLIASNQKSKELFSSEVGNLSFISSEVAHSMFPDVKLYQNNNICYFPFKLCHSLPIVNKRGRTFTPKVLKNSFASLNDQLIDLDHALDANGLGSDRIIGHVKATKFDLPKDYDTKELAELASGKGQEALPVMGLGVLFMRAKGIPEIIEAHKNKTRTYSVSMECGHKWKDAYFLYRDEFIPLPDSEIAMRNCIEADKVKEYKGHQLAACLGGLNGSVDFWGVAMTDNPADSKADVLNFIAGQSSELSSENIFFMPLHRFANSELELANSSVDKKISELATIGIIGETAPHTDGHTHYILSNLLLYHPALDHSHCMRDFNLSRGSNPSITGVTDDYHFQVQETKDGVSTGNYKSISHKHLVNIPLKGKYKLNVDKEGSSDSDVDSLDDFIPEEASMKLNELFKKLDETIEKVAKATDDKDRQAANNELASIRKDIAKIESEKATEEEKNTFLQDQIKAGNVISKDEFEKKLKEASDKKEAEFQSQLKSQEVKQTRVQKCLEAKIDLDTIYDGINDKEGKPMTFRKKLEAIPVEDESTFNMDFLTWSALSSKEKEDEEAARKKEEADKKLAEAANDGGGGNGKTPKVLRAIAGAGHTTSTETASTGTTKAAPNRLLGKGLLTSLNK